MSFDEVIADLKGAPLPLNEAGVAYWKSMLTPYYGEKKAQIRAHLAITLFLSVALCVQFLKVVRQKAITAHRVLGRITILVALAATPGFAMLIAGMTEKPIAQYAEYPAVLGIPYFGIQGVLQARNKQIADHKASMIMFASCFFFFGVQRLVLMAMGPLHSGPWARYTPLGPWKEWSEREYDLFFNLSIAAAFQITFGCAMYKAYVVPAQALAAAAKTK